MEWVVCVFLFKQKTAYEMRISDWSSDVCSSDLQVARGGVGRGRGIETEHRDGVLGIGHQHALPRVARHEILRAPVDAAVRSPVDRDVPGVRDGEIGRA